MRGSAHRSFGIEVASLAGVPEDVTKRAKQILKSLEKNDITRTMSLEKLPEESFEEEQKLSEVEEILLETDINSMTPMQALTLIASLKDKVSK